MEDGGGGGGQGSPCQYLHCVHLPTPSALSRSPPPFLPLRQPLGSVWLIKEEEEEEVAAAGSRHNAVCLGPSAPARPGTRSKGLDVELPSFPPPLCSPAPHKQHHHTPQQETFYCGDEKAGLLGQAGLRIRIRLARVGWQMAA